MHLFNRTAAGASRGATNIDDVRPIATYNMPSKAERLLGTTDLEARQAAIIVERFHQTQQAPGQTRVAEQKHPVALSHEDFQSGTMPREPRSSSQATPRDTHQASHLRNIPRKESSSTLASLLQSERSDSTLRSYYDPAQQPLFVSQQTSASSARDMALRKGAPAIRNADGKPPLKPSLKQSSLRREASNGWRSKKLDISRLFSSGKHAPKEVNIVETASLVSDESEAFESGGDSVKRNSTALAQVESRDSGNSGSHGASGLPRAKVFERDIYDSKRTNVRRPPKGIKNWFDGFDVSSDEDDAPSKAPQIHELPAMEPLPSIFSPYGAQHTDMSSERSPSQLAQSGHHPYRSSYELMGSLPRTRDSYASTDTEVPPMRSARKHGPSRLATSRLACESVLSLSSSSEDEDFQSPRLRDSLVSKVETVTSDMVVSDAYPMGVQRPSIPPRKLHSIRASTYGTPNRESNSTMHTSGSIPITMSRDAHPAPGRPRPVSAAAKHVHSSTDNLHPPSPSQTHTSSSVRRSLLSSPRYDYEGSTAGETADSYPSDASRLMAVTDEEMALLEMMRSKRAAMANHSFTEGYQLALKQEEEQLMLRRQSAHRAAMQMLKEKRDRTHGRDDSMTSTTLAEDDSENEKRLDALRQEVIDRSLKLERFLAAETSLDDLFPRPPTGTEGKRDWSEKDRTLQPTKAEPKSRHSQAQMNGSKQLPEYDAEDVITPDFFMENFVPSSKRFDHTNALTAAAIRTSDHSRGRLRDSLHAGVPPPIPERSPNRVEANFSKKQLPARVKFEDKSARSDPPHRIPPFNFDERTNFPDLTSLPHDLSSIGTSTASPQTPTFPVGSTSGRFNIDVVGSETSSSLGRAHSPDTSIGMASTTAKPVSSSKRLSALGRHATQPENKRYSSTAGLGNEGEEFYAAWAELGVGKDIAGSRRTRVR